MKTPQRKLAAIMFTDIVGYTALMGSDEKRALEQLRVCRQIHYDLISQHNGTLIKEMGDGNLVQFPSAMEAVLCAVGIQKRAGEELDGTIRIGIHLGDVTFDHADVFGNDVNIASRLQSIADPGGIYISESVQNSIRAQTEIQTNFLGEFLLKNVNFPMKTYAVRDDGLPVPSKEKIKSLLYPGKKKSLKQSYAMYAAGLLILAMALIWYQFKTTKSDAQISSLVFLPFENYTGTDTLNYLMAGMHDALIGEVGKISSLRVPGTKTANVYSDADKTIPEIAGELNVDAGVETSVTCIGDEICFRVKVIGAMAEEKQLWTKEYRVKKGEIDNWYRNLAKEISREVSISISSEEEALLSTARPIDPRAYDLYMRGKLYLDQINPVSLTRAKEYFQLAAEEEPEWSQPYAGLAESVGYQLQMNFISREEALPLMRENMEKALQLDPNSAYSHYVNGVIAVWTEFDWEKGETEFLNALALNPNHVRARMFYAHLLTILRRTDEALFHAQQAEELDPLNAFTLGLYADVLIRAGQCEEAKAFSQKALSIEPGHHFATGELMVAHECLGEHEEAYEIRKRITLALWENYGVTDRLDKVFQNEGWLAFNKADIEFHEEMVAKDGMMVLVWQLSRYITTGELDKAVEYCQKMFETKDPNLPYISAQNIYDLLKDHEDYIQLLKTLHLPYE